jgi:predicted PurR-regulated permease PerM
MLMAVALNAMTNRLGWLIRLPHALRLAIVCVALAALFSSVLFLGSTTMAQQAAALSDTIKSQLVNVKAFLDSHGIDTSYFELGSGSVNQGAPSGGTPAGAASAPHLPGAGALASSGGFIVSQTFKLLLGTISAVGNVFIVLFLGLAFAARRVPQRIVVHRTRNAARPRHHHRRPHRRDAGALADCADYHDVRRLPGNLDRAVHHRHPERVHPGHSGWPARLHPDGRRADRGADRGAREPRLRLDRSLSALILFLGVHGLESYVLTPIVQRQALDIPPATLFAFQILLGVVFGIWGLSLALPLMAVAKVMIDYFKSGEAAAESAV